jgi:hypothetical protein
MTVRQTEASPEGADDESWTAIAEEVASGRAVRLRGDQHHQLPGGPAEPRPDRRRSPAADHAWWRKRRPLFDLYVSQVVLDEILAGDPDAAERRAALASGISLLDITLRWPTSPPP